jgi:LuxR family maltose regulon positive regulatory protein
MGDEIGRVKDPAGPVAAALCALVAGDLHLARSRLADAEATDALSSTGWLAAVCQLAGGAVRLLAGDTGSGAALVEEAIETADSVGEGWLARLARASLSLAGQGHVVGDLRHVPMRDQDAWGSALLGLLDAWGGLLHGDCPAESLAEVTVEFQALGAGALAAWAGALRALALAGHGRPGAREAGLHAEAAARAAGVPGARLLAIAALIEADPAHSTAHRAVAGAIRDEGGLDLARLCGGRDPLAAAERPAPAGGLEIRCFGGLSVSVDGRPLDLRPVKPRARMLLRMLAAHSGRPVHREVLQEALWPEADHETGIHNLQVAMSSLRQVLEPGVARGGSAFLVRDGDAYRLGLPAGASIDVLSFEAALGSGLAARAAGQTAAVVAACAQALALYTGELLPEDGPAEWVVRLRERYRGRAVEAARLLAETLLEAGDNAGAVDAAAAGLHADRYSDALWRLVISARERSGDPVAAARARRDYLAMLDELGVAPTSSAV